MTDDTKIRPALTIGEWADLNASRPRAGDVSLVRGALCIGNDMDETTSLHDSAEMRHAIAALALHGQPFGFTREDVSVLRSVLTRLGEGGKRHNQIASLAARIAALLPPQ